MLPVVVCQRMCCQDTSSQNMFWIQIVIDLKQSLELLKQAVSKSPKLIREWAKKEKAFTNLHNNDKFRALVKL